MSTDAQQKEGTIESQVLELKRQIVSAGDVLVQEYVDDGYSGREWLTREKAELVAALRCCMRIL